MTIPIQTNDSGVSWTDVAAFGADLKHLKEKFAFCPLLCSPDRRHPGIWDYFGGKRILRRNIKSLIKSVKAFRSILSFL